MANRYWIGTGTWNASNTANWSATSGGATGASVPGSADTAIMDANSGAGVCTLGANVSAQRLFVTNYTGTLAYAGYKISLSGNAAVIYQENATHSITGYPLIELTYSGSTGTRTVNVLNTPAEANTISVNVIAGSDTVAIYNFAKDINFTGFTGTGSLVSATYYGDFTLGSGMTVGASATAVNFRSTNVTPRTITSNNVAFNLPVIINGSGGTYALGDAFTITGQRLQLSNGTFDANGKNVNISSLLISAGTKTLTLGSGTWTVAGSGSAWDAVTNVTGLTVSASTATISMTSASAKTFAGGGKTWPTLNQGGAGALTISGNNTFQNITNTTQPVTFTFTAGTTQTVSSFTASGTSGNLVTLQSSSAGSQFTLSDASGTNSVSYCSIKDSAATGGADWQSYTTNGNVDAGNNTGWVFNVPVTYSYSSDIKLRSMAQRGRF